MDIKKTATIFSGISKIVDGIALTHAWKYL
jgi:hypothetical protein